jgi:HTH-type transcriptional regulator/antitoxin HigA
VATNRPQVAILGYYRGCNSQVATSWPQVERGMDMEIWVIKTKEQHQKYLKEIEKLMGLSIKLNSLESKRLELLGVLVEKYEKEKFPFEIPTAIEAVKFRMEQQNLSRKDLIPYMGCRSRVSEFFSGKRALSKNVIRSLSEGLEIPIEILFGK